jgi:hypothetical protein
MLQPKQEAVVGMVLGQILAAGGQPEHARLVLQRSAEMFLKLGQEDSAREAVDLIRRLGPKDISNNN